MAKIKLSDVYTEQIQICKKPIVIIDTKTKQGYQTTKGFVSFGGIFLSIYNEMIEAFSEEPPSLPSYTLEYFQGVSITDIADYMKEGILSRSLSEKIKANTKTLAFRVGIYNNKPTLYYVGDEGNLFLYDMLMIKQHNIKVKLCADCGKAFIPKTKGVYCSDCQNIIIRNKAKYQALKKDPARLMFTRLQQRIQKRESNSSQYRSLFEWLASNNKEVSWLEKWSELDKRYQKIKNSERRNNYSFSEKEWNDALKAVHISSIEEFEKWLVEMEQ